MANSGLVFSVCIFLISELYLNFMTLCTYFSFSLQINLCPKFVNFTCVDDAAMNETFLISNTQKYVVCIMVFDNHKNVRKIKRNSVKILLYGSLHYMLWYSIRIYNFVYSFSLFFFLRFILLTLIRPYTSSGFWMLLVEYIYYFFYIYQCHC